MTTRTTSTLTVTARATTPDGAVTHVSTSIPVSLGLSVVDAFRAAGKALLHAARTEYELDRPDLSNVAFHFGTGEGLPPCPMCLEVERAGGPSHLGSPSCESGSIASGGYRSHCTCDTCF